MNCFLATIEELGLLGRLNVNKSLGEYMTRPLNL
jgi:hypothetical protein